jgi:hypothetical protein
MIIGRIVYVAQANARFDLKVDTKKRNGCKPAKEALRK